jgi:hypothetical protein
MAAKIPLVLGSDGQPQQLQSGDVLAVLQATAEASSNPVADDGTTITQAATTRYYTFFTLPSTEKFYLITGIEWKNGATAAGTGTCGIALVDANPPSLAGACAAAWGIPVANSGTNSIQRQSNIISMPIRGGTIVGAWLESTGTTQTYKGSTVGSANNKRTETAGTINPIDSSAWVASTTQPYMKIYYIGYK